MTDENGGRIRTVILEGLQVAETAVLINEGELVIIPAIFGRICHSVTDQTCRRDIFHINLNSLTRVIHLLIRLWDVLGVRELHSHFSPTPQKAVQP